MLHIIGIVCTNSSSYNDSITGCIPTERFREYHDTNRSAAWLRQECSPVGRTTCNIGGRPQTCTFRNISQAISSKWTRVMLAWHALIGNRWKIAGSGGDTRKESYSVTAKAWRLMERSTSIRWIFDVRVWPCITRGISNGPSQTSTGDKEVTN